MMERKKVLFEKYEVGRLLGKGNFGTVHHATHIESGENVAIKSMRKDQVRKEGMMNQITREISVMRLVKHPNIVEIKEVMATKTKIYIVMEYIKGGDLFSKLEKEKKLKEDLARRYFQQLISAVDFCHSRGVYHRDLKLENLLLDESGTNLKVADFGLSAFLGQIHEDGLLHTMCGAPAYVAPEILKGKGYDGGKTDIWSCGVILYTMLAGHLPFQDENVMRMFGKISLGKYNFGPSFPHEPKLLIKKILVLKPENRLGIQEMMKIPWFKKAFLGFTLEQKLVETPETNTESSSPAFFNAFELISSMASGFDLSNLFEPKLRTRSTFTSRSPTSGIMSRIEEMGRGLKYKVTRMSEFQVKLVGPTEGRKGPLSVVAEVSEVASEVAVVEFSKSAGDTLEYLHFCEEEARPALKDIVWSWQGENVIPLVTDTTSVPRKI